MNSLSLDLDSGKAKHYTQGGEREISFVDLLDILNNNRAVITPLLPPGVRVFACTPTSFAIMIEEFPGIRPITYKYRAKDSSMKKIDLTLYFPWIYHIFSGKLNPTIVNGGTMAFSHQKLMYDSDKIGYMAVPNLRYNTNGITSWCFGDINLGDPDNKKFFTLNEAVNKLFNGIWGSEFNTDILDNQIYLESITKCFGKKAEIKEELEKSSGERKDFLEVVLSPAGDSDTVEKCKYMYWWEKLSRSKEEDLKQVFTLRNELPWKDTLNKYLKDIRLGE